MRYKKDNKLKTQTSGERITVRLSNTDMNGLKKIQESGEFEEMSSALKWCIHFTVVMLRAVPAAIIESFMEGNGNDQVENTPEEASK